MASETGRPKVFFAIGCLARGGSERQLVQLIREAHPKHIEATVLTFSPVCDPGHAEQLSEIGVKLIQVSPSAGPRPLRPIVSVPRVYRLLREVRPDVVYPWLEEASTTVTPAALALGIPIIIARRSVCGSPAEGNPFFRASIRWAEGKATLVTGNSNAVLAVARERGIDFERLRLVRNGHPPVEPLAPPSGEVVKLGYLSNYRVEKGHARLLDALQLIDTKTPWHMDLVGAGPLHDSVRQEIAARGLGNRVTAGGPVTDIPGFWADHDVAVLLSDDEGSPNALIEAAMLGRPLVGTDGGGTREIVSPEAGLLVSREPAEIAAALESLIEDPQLRRRLGEGARRQAIAQHDLPASVAGHLAVIDEVLAQRVRGN